MSSLGSEFTNISILENEVLSPHTTYGIGGVARYFAKATSADELVSLLSWAKANQLPLFILGKGSNTVFDDRGVKGLVILIKLCQFETEEQGEEVLVRVGAGFSFARLGTLCSQNGWTGLEFASGIPGSVGGAVYMNAGASGAETSQVLRRVKWMDPNGAIHELLKEEISYSYRYSAFQEKAGIILDAEFILRKESGAKEKQKKIIEGRIRSQPYDQKSAGCVFRNPSPSSSCGSSEMNPPLSAGAMIDQLGFKGRGVGEIEVSTLHANFLVNRGRGTAEDLFQLVEQIRQEVVGKFNVQLELEIRKVEFEPALWWDDAVAR